MDRLMLGEEVLPDLKGMRYSSSKKKSEEIIASFKYRTNELICHNLKLEKIDMTVNLSEVKEIRTGKNCRDFLRWAQETKKIDSSRCFSVMFGTGFKLQSLSISVPTKTDADKWVKVLEYLMEQHAKSYIGKLDIWLFKQFKNITDLYGQDTLSLKQMQDFMSCINFKISMGKLKDKFQDLQNPAGELVGYSEFQRIVTDFLQMNDQLIFTDCFGKYILSDGHVGVNMFNVFLQHEQREVELGNYFHKYVNLDSRGIAYMNLHEAVNFLFSKDNQVWDTQYDRVHQDMTRPLSHYWIATSHNTYLTGNQLSSESSVEAYARVLRQGCRCIELDCWDGSNGYPVIYHGRTLTTKISFIEVIKKIRDHAFATSEYPVILSIENHCSVEQQKIMAKKLHEVFGMMLITQPLFREEIELPSPHELRRKILLKGKTLPRSARESISEFEEKKNEISDLIKSGKMYIQEESRWMPYFFALTHDKLTYTEIETEDHDRISNSDSDMSTVVPEEEIHFSKKWFHGKISEDGSGHAIAEERVNAFGVEGCFLVRESEKKVGNYSLCFLSGGTALHLRIWPNLEKTQYYLTSSKRFDSLYSLISYYRKNSLETPDFRIERFTKGVPLPEKPPESFLWFYPNKKRPDPMDREKAVELLQKIPLNGAFLVRYSKEFLETGKGPRFVITFRQENNIKQCRVKEDEDEDGGYLVVANRRFESIDELITHYKEKSFYKGLKLSHPVEEQLFQFAHNVDIKDAEYIYASPDYLNTDEDKKVRAVFSYHPPLNADGNLLTFDRGDVITNVVKQDELWWKGDLGRQKQKTFPANMVEEIEPLQGPFGELQKGAVGLGKVVLEKGNDDEFPYILKIHGSVTGPLVAVKTLKEAKEWQQVIKWANDRANERNTLATEVQIKHKIAEELSRQIVYLRTVAKVNQEEVIRQGRVYNKMTSYTETNAKKLLSQDPKFYVWLHEVQLSRVYPKAQRVNSSNYDPIRHWNCGAQMVALNYQTPDQPLQLNHGKFRQNGRCGYVLRPEFMFRRNFRPGCKEELEKNGIKPLSLHITVIAARLLFRADSKSISSPFVEIEIIGENFDYQMIRTIKYIPDNGFNPLWNEKFKMKVLNPDLALIRFSVSDQDSFGDTYIVGQATYPVKCLRQGYRSVILENGFGEEIISSMLIHLCYTCESESNKNGLSTWVG